MTEKEWLASGNGRSLMICLIEQFGVEGNGHLMELAREICRNFPKTNDAEIQRVYKESGYDCPSIVFANILRDVFGNPFRPWFAEHGEVKSTPLGDELLLEQWRTDNVRRLVAGMLEPKLRICNVCKQWVKNCPCPESGELYEYDFSAMPILADALEEAGCTNEEILQHCRSAGEHTLGCWVLRLLAGPKWEKYNLLKKHMEIMPISFDGSN